MKATCKNSANLEQETKTTKIVTYPLFSLASSISVLRFIKKLSLKKGSAIATCVTVKQSNKKETKSST